MSGITREEAGIRQDVFTARLNRSISANLERWFLSAKVEKFLVIIEQRTAVEELVLDIDTQSIVRVDREPGRNTSWAEATIGGLRSLHGSAALIPAATQGKMERLFMGIPLLQGCGVNP